jgi:hypothetical protein
MDACFNTREISFLQCPGDADENVIRLAEINVPIGTKRTLCPLACMSAFGGEVTVHRLIGNCSP